MSFEMEAKNYDPEKIKAAVFPAIKRKYAEIGDKITHGYFTATSHVYNQISISKQGDSYNVTYCLGSYMYFFGFNHTELTENTPHVITASHDDSVNATIIEGGKK